MRTIDQWDIHRICLCKSRSFVDVQNLFNFVKIDGQLTGCPDIRGLVVNNWFMRQRASIDLWEFGEHDRRELLEVLRGKRSLNFPSAS